MNKLIGIYLYNGTLYTAGKMNGFPLHVKTQINLRYIMLSVKKQAAEENGQYEAQKHAKPNNIMFRNKNVCDKTIQRKARVRSMCFFCSH